MNSITIGRDATHHNIGHLPPGQAAGYSTGSSDIRWISQDWAARPGAVRICQDVQASDATADALDVERFAATNTAAAGWVKRARGSIASRARPGQRLLPLIYTSASNVTPLVNALLAGGVSGGCGLWVANWNLTEPQAAAEVEAAAGPFPIEAVQWDSAQYYDVDVFGSAWLAAVVQDFHEHTTDGVQTYGELASSRNMRALSWLALQGQLDPAGGERLAAAGLPPAGLIWRSVGQ